jgi:hypothetical protein
MAQTVVCNRHHSVDQQLCRWLLLSLDHLPGDGLQKTGVLIIHMLGLRREGVTQSAWHLQMADLIRYSRGHTGARPARAGAFELRVLRGGHEGARSVAAFVPTDRAMALPGAKMESFNHPHNRLAHALHIQIEGGR